MSSPEQPASMLRIVDFEDDDRAVVESHYSIATPDEVRAFELVDETIRPALGRLTLGELDEVQACIQGIIDRRQK